jgi:quercetin dioxygenase-like cupin family protein
MRLILRDHDFGLTPGEVVELDTQVPHWFGRNGTQPAEVLSLFGRQGERMHVRASTPDEASWPRGAGLRAPGARHPWG